MGWDDFYKLLIYILIVPTDVVLCTSNGFLANIQILPRIWTINSHNQVQTYGRRRLHFLNMTNQNYQEEILTQLYRLQAFSIHRPQYTGFVVFFENQNESTLPFLISLPITIRFFCLNKLSLGLNYWQKSISQSCKSWWWAWRVLRNFLTHQQKVWYQAKIWY